MAALLAQASEGKQPSLDPLPALDAARPEPGPESGGLRLRFVALPRFDAGNDGYPDHTQPPFPLMEARLLRPE